MDDTVTPETSTGAAELVEADTLVEIMERAA